MSLNTSDNMKNKIECGLICDIYRDQSESSNGGISSKVKSVTLIGLPKSAQIFEPTNDRPAVRLVDRNGYLTAEPVDQPNGLVGPMFGDTFIYSCDSRFPSNYPIPLHDRFETQETYDVLSR